ncbi:MAG: hypothetical protein ACMXYD_05055 [Candidatus Woesearchaeota archaeon]
MDEEHYELLKNFFRRWSTLEITPESRMLLREDVMHVRVLLEVDEADTSMLEGVEKAQSRDFFAKKYQELTTRK